MRWLRVYGPVLRQATAGETWDVPFEVDVNFVITIFVSVTFFGEASLKWVQDNRVFEPIAARILGKLTAFFKRRKSLCRRCIAYEANIRISGTSHNLWIDNPRDRLHESSIWMLPLNISSLLKKYHRHGLNVLIRSLSIDGLKFHLIVTNLYVFGFFVLINMCCNLWWQLLSWTQIRYNFKCCLLHRHTSGLSFICYLLSCTIPFFMTNMNGIFF